MLEEGLINLDETWTIKRWHCKSKLKIIVQLKFHRSTVTSQGGFEDHYDGGSTLKARSYRTI
jgi:hypothetical protein